MKHFEYVARFNNYADAQMPDYVLLNSLEDMVRFWFVNDEATLTSWAFFQQEARRAFDSDHRRKKDEDALRTRIVQPKYTVTRFIEVVLRAFPNVTEAWETHFLLRIFREDILITMTRDSHVPVKYFVTIATRIQLATSSRCRHPQRLPELNNLKSRQFTAGVDGSLRQAIRRIV